MPIKGIIIPIMGTNKIDLKSTSTLYEGLGETLFTKTQQRVLGYLFGQPDRSYFANQLINLTGSGSGAVQRELNKLVASGLVNSEMRGNQRHFQANKSAPIFKELTQIVQKTFGMNYPISEALAPYRELIKYAFIFGSIAKQEDTVKSDIDIFIVSDKLTYSDLISQLMNTEAKLGRHINATIYTESDLCSRLQSANAFITRVFAQPKIWIIGDESNLST